MGWLLLLLISAAGFALARTITARPRTPWLLVFWASAGVALGAGLAGLLEWAWALSPACLLIVLIPAALGVLWQRRSVSPIIVAEEDKPSWWMLAILGVLLAIGVYTALLFFGMGPHGDWDAWAIHNLKAKLLLSQSIREMLPLLGYAHPDYPLLQSAIVAALWRVEGQPSTALAFSVQLLYALALTGLITSTVAILRGSRLGVLAGIVLAGTLTIWRLAAAQYADLPLALFLSLAICALCMATQGAHAQWLYLAGLGAGLAAATKQEGYVFAAVVTLGIAGWCWRELRDWRPAASFALGALPAVGVLAWFLLWLPPLAESNARLAITGRRSGFPSLVDAPFAMFAKLLQFGGIGVGWVVILAAVMLVLGWRLRKELRIPALIVSAVIAAELLLTAYIYSRVKGLQEMVANSFDRVLLHVWPGLVLLVFLGLELGKVATQTAPSARTKKTRSR